jgi:hypothetical protein
VTEHRDRRTRSTSAAVRAGGVGPRQRLIGPRRKTVLGIVRHWWVTAKLTLLLAVIGVGATLTGPSIDTMLDFTERCDPSQSSARLTLIAAAAGQVAMLLAATILAVFKPGGQTRWPRLTVLGNR